jgi:hypothetical protein
VGKHGFGVPVSGRNYSIRFTSLVCLEGRLNSELGCGGEIKTKRIKAFVALIPDMEVNT